MSDQRIQEIKARAESVAEFESLSLESDQNQEYHYIDCDGNHDWANPMITTDSVDAARFVLAAFEDIPWLLEQLESMQQEQQEPKPDWTPCAEGLPTKTADYKVTVQVGSEMGTWRETKIIPYRIVDGVGAWVLPKSDWLIYGVIAWTKTDEPWSGTEATNE